MRIRKSIIALFLSPAVLVYLLIFLYPTVRSLWMSFYRVPSISSGTSEWSFAGLANYLDLSVNSYFLTATANVLGIWIGGGVLIFGIAFVLAIILHSGVKGVGFWKSLIYLPNTVSVVVMATVWLQYIFNSSFGFLSTLFAGMGLEDLASVQWTDNDHIYLSMVAAYSFGIIGYFMLILSAGMDRIPSDFNEAARIEGAGPTWIFFRITLPLLSEVFRTALVLWTMTAFNFFAWSATFGLLSPSTMTPGFYMYQNVFGLATKTIYQTNAFNVGTGAAVGVLITLAVLAGSFLISRFFPKEQLEY